MGRGDTDYDGDHVDEEVEAESVPGTSREGECSRHGVVVVIVVAVVAIVVVGSRQEVCERRLYTCNISIHPLTDTVLEVHTGMYVLVMSLPIPTAGR